MGRWGNRLEDIFFPALLAQLGYPNDAYGNRPFTVGYVREFMGPSDPSLTADFLASESCPTSYAANAQVFDGHPSLTRSFSDGLSNTILLGEHFARCGKNIFYYAKNEVGFPAPSRRPTFADGGAILRGLTEGDVYPITSSSPPTDSSKPGRGHIPSSTINVEPSDHNVQQCRQAGWENHQPNAEKWVRPNTGADPAPGRDVRGPCRWQRPNPQRFDFPRDVLGDGDAVGWRGAGFRLVNRVLTRIVVRDWNDVR